MNFRHYSSALRRCAGLLALLTLASFPVFAQAPAWDGATPGNSSQADGYSEINGLTTDAQGNVYVTGFFNGSVSFGSIVLTSRQTTFLVSTNDLFVAKYVPSTGTWAWAVRGGGLGDEVGVAVAVQGGSVYVAASMRNTRSNDNQVQFGSSDPAGPTVPLGGTSPTYSNDLVLLKYQDNGSSVTCNWGQVGGGTGDDYARAVAVSGSNVYLTGSIANNAANTNAVVLGGNGTTPGTAPQAGASSRVSQDLVLVKYTDQGSTATFNWAQVGGGSGGDEGTSLAVSSTSVYVAGSLANTTTNANAVVLGGSGLTPGTVPINGASSTASADLLLVKYQDNGSTAAVVWTQVAGGTGFDGGYAVAVSGSSVYLAGSIANTATNTNAVVLGGNGTTPGTASQAGTTAQPFNDLLLAKYTDQGSTATFNWSQVGGGTYDDRATGLAVQGNSVYVAGTLSSDPGTVFGGSGLQAGTVPVPGIASNSGQDLVLAKYTDNGSTGTFGWARTGGGTDFDRCSGVALSGASVAVAGTLTNAEQYSFEAAGNTQLLPSVGFATTGVLALATDAGSSGSWTDLRPVFGGGNSVTTAVATDAQGNVFVTGHFSGLVYFGSLLLGSAGSRDLFVAKYVPATNTWAWAQRGGGTDDDRGRGIAVSGSSVYITGYLTNNTANSNRVRLGGLNPATSAVTVNGATATISTDLLLAKYQDNGSSAALLWTQVGGGTGNDYGNAVAVSGNALYVAGSLTNDRANTNGVLLGGNGNATPGTLTQYDASPTANPDLLLAKYQDNGSTAAAVWTQVGGGTGFDFGYAVAVSGSNVYVTGSLENSTANANEAVFGGSGATAGTRSQAGATPTVSYDLLLTKYIDNGNTAAFGWSQVGGGTSYDGGSGVAVNGTSVYVTGNLFNDRLNTNAAVFGGSSLTAGTVPQSGASATASYDLLLAKYQDAGASGLLRWTQIGGGTSDDYGGAVAVQGSTVYVAGSLLNDATNSTNVVFGGSGTTAGTLAVPGLGGGDLAIARFQDTGANGLPSWVRVGGGQNYDQGYGLAVSGQQVYAAGFIMPAATFGATTIAVPRGSAQQVVARLTDLALQPLPTRAVAGASSLLLWPNPSPGTATLAGLPPGTTVQVLSTLSQPVATAGADATGTARLGGLAPGLYLVRVGSSVVRLAVE